MRIEVQSGGVEGQTARAIYGLRISHVTEGGRQRVLKSTLAEFKQFVTRTKEQIVFHTLDGDVVFNIVWPPGRFCLSCKEELPSPQADPFADKCRKHVKTHGSDAEKTERWPHGYRASYDSYDCILEK